MDLPHGEHVEVAVGQRKALVFYTGQPKAERQDGEREGEEAGDDEEQSPQSKTDRREREPVSKRETKHPQKTKTHRFDTPSACSRR